MPISTSPKSSGSSSADISIITPGDQPSSPTSVASYGYPPRRQRSEDRHLLDRSSHWGAPHYGKIGESSKHRQVSESSWDGSGDESEHSAFMPSMEQRQADRHATRNTLHSSQSYASTSTHPFIPHTHTDERAFHIPSSRSETFNTWSDADSDSALYEEASSWQSSPHRRSRKRRLLAIPYVEIPLNEVVSRRIANGEYIQWMPGWRESGRELSETTGSESGTCGEGAEEAEVEQVVVLLSLDEDDMLEGVESAPVKMEEAEVIAPMLIQSDIDMELASQSEEMETESKYSEYEESEDIPSETDSSDSEIIQIEVPFSAGRSKSEEAQAAHGQEQESEDVVMAVASGEDKHEEGLEETMVVIPCDERPQLPAPPVEISTSHLVLTGGLRAEYPWHRGKSCHQCRQPWTARPMVCSKRGGGFKCEFAYCEPCCEKYSYVTFDAKSTSFICPRCNDVCDCSRCYRRVRLPEDGDSQREIIARAPRTPIVASPVESSAQLPILRPRWSGKSVAQVTGIIAAEEALRESAVTWTRSGEPRERPKPRSPRIRVPSSPLSPLPSAQRSSPLPAPIILKFKMPRRVPMKRPKEVDSDGDTVGGYSSEEDGRSRAVHSSASRGDSISPRSTSSKKRPSTNDYLSSLSQSRINMPPDRVTDSPFPDYSQSSKTIPLCRETKETLAPSISTEALLGCDLDELWMPSSPLVLRAEKRRPVSPVRRSPSLPSLITSFPNTLIADLPDQIPLLPLSPITSPPKSPSLDELWLPSLSPDIPMRTTETRPTSPVQRAPSLPVISSLPIPPIQNPQTRLRVLSVSPVNSQSRTPSPVRIPPTYSNHIPRDHIRNTVILSEPQSAISQPSLGPSENPQTRLRVLSVSPVSSQSRSPSPVRIPPTYSNYIPQHHILNPVISSEIPSAINHPSLGPSTDNPKLSPQESGRTPYPAGPDHLSQSVQHFYDTNFTKYNILPTPLHSQLSLGSAYPLRPMSRFENLKSSYLSLSPSSTSLPSISIPPMIFPPMRSPQTLLHPSFRSTMPHPDFTRQKSFW